MKTLTFGSLFAGIGGFDLAMGRVGFRCAWQVEIDHAARRVLARHWPDVPRLEDVRGCGRGNLAPVDVICGGFPCQDLSCAGKGAGIVRGTRSGLFYEMARITDELRPAILLWENVPGLLSNRGGRDFLAVLAELDRIGYCGAWTGLDARFFGLAQRRRRIFGVFARADIGAQRCAEILSLRTRRKGHPAAGSKEGADVAGTLGSGAPGSGWRDDLDRVGAFVASTLRSRQHRPGVSAPGRGGEDDSNLVASACTPGDRRASGNRAAEKIVVSEVFQKTGAGAERAGAPSLAAGDDNGDNQVVVSHTLRAAGCDASEDGTGRGTPLIPFVVRSANSNDRETHAAEADTARCLDTTGGEAPSQGGTVVAQPIPIDMRQALRGETMTNNRSEDATSGGAPSLANSHTPAGAFTWQQGGETQLGMSRSGGTPLRANQTLAAQIGTSVRRLTPVECLRLQGFPDDYLDLGPPLADGAKYRLIGNAVAVPVVEWIARRISERLPKEEEPR